MMKCSKCGSTSDVNTQAVWKCTSCNKGYRLTLDKVKQLSAKKRQGQSKAALLNCKNCSAALDDGNEQIYWKCSCGNTNVGKLVEFGEEKAVKKNNESNKTAKKKNIVPVIALCLVAVIAIGTGIFFHTRNSEENLTQKEENSEIDFEKELYKQSAYEQSINVAENNKVVEGSKKDAVKEPVFETEVDETFIEETNDEKETIINFYQAMKELNGKVNSGTYDSLEKIVADVFDEIIAFDELSSDKVLEYKDYCHDMQQNVMYATFKKEFIEDTEKYDLDSSITSYGYAIIVGIYTDAILEIPLPFDNDIQVQNTESNGDYTEVANKFTSILNESIEAGMNLEFFMDSYGNYAYPANPIVYETSVGTMEFQPKIKYVLDGSFLMNLEIDLDTSFSSYFPKYVTFSNEETEVTLNSTHIATLNSIGLHFVQIYRSEWDSSMNSEYMTLKELFRNADAITVILDEGVTFQLSKTDVDTINQYFELMDILIKLYESN